MLGGTVIILDENNGIGDKNRKTMYGTKVLDIDTKCATSTAKHCENRSFRDGAVII